MLTSIRIVTAFLRFFIMFVEKMFLAIWKIRFKTYLFLYFYFSSAVENINFK